MTALSRSAWFAALVVAAASLTDCKEKKKTKACAQVRFDSAVIETCLGDVSYRGDTYDWLYEAEVEFDGQAYILSVELYGDFVQGGITAGAHELGVGDDANYATVDSNLTLTLLMNTDHHVVAAFKCGSGLAQIFPLLLCTLSLGLLRKRVRNP